MNRPQTLAEILTGDLPGVIADFQGIIVDINEHFEIFTGWEKQEIVGQLISVILPSYFRESHHMLSGAEKSGNPHYLVVFT